MMQKKLKRYRAAGVQLLMGAIAAGLVGSFSTAVKAQMTIPDRGIQYNEDTLIEFEFRESHGYYRSTFGVINLATREMTDLIAEVKPFDDFSDRSELNNPSTRTDDVGTSRDFVGTPGNSVPDPIRRFTFDANTQYAFYLKVFRPNGTLLTTLYSTRFEQLSGSQDADSAQSVGGLSDGKVGDRKGVRISWDDTGVLRPDGVRPPGKDRDFDDFIVEAGGFLVTSAPCPRVK
ncbi:hypothetical protein [Argonema galeatum]|uniref:hypothetical protein n=1 Tax=Argonema galeatum TaxID=2942762 RepID=UPI00201132B3|nr:hypothetical protein [Argonema galeatum]MCL1465772.1 hypothetical protein [Argonema galeatum A003/A1]